VSNSGGVDYENVWGRSGEELNLVGDGNLPNPNSEGDFERAYVSLNSFVGEGNEKVRVYMRVQKEDNRNAVLYLNNVELFLSDNPEPVDPGLNNTVIFPNPTDDIFNIAFNLEDYEDVKIQIISTTGQLVYDVDFPNTLNQTYSFTKAMLSQGVFIVKINSDVVTITKRLIVR
jgi:hypothetical protein